ncbi:MAG: hypothetical protein BWY89_01754 [Bacteroidetes bacterium ADurb.BinA012]|nr:MAG: hypothetical protein BWY89_01754 [Bacteroidetes bacterium ADurb.BinA012]
MSFRSSMREKSTGPNSETVARNLTPFCSEIVSSSTGKPIVEYGRLIFPCLFLMKSFSCPGLARPLRSPFTSITSEGIPFSDSCSAST